jgi:hypothetical protein
LLVVSVASLVWTSVIVITGGFSVEFGAFRFSSRQTRNPLLLAVVTGAVGAALTTREERRRGWSAAREYFERLLTAVNALPSATAPALAAVAAIVTALVGVTMGTIDAGGSDAYGYVSEGELWAKGTLRVEQPLVDDLDWELDIEALTPLGYRPTEDRRAIVPVYSPGLPLVIALFQRLGGRPAVFYVVPLLGSVLVWATYLMGARVAGPGVGLAAAILMATAPAFLFQLMVTMSDVPVAAWWTLCLALVLADPPFLALFAGISAGMAILTRPNLVLLAIVPGAWLLWRALWHRQAGRPALTRLLLFCPGVIAGGLAVAAINTAVYGSPLVSGYGSSVEGTFSTNHFWTNLLNYSKWFVQSNTPVAILAVAAPFLARRAAAMDTGSDARWPYWMLLTFAAGVFASYLFFTVFHDWWYLRFVISAFPPIFVLTSVVVVAIVRRLTHRALVPLTALVIVLVALHGVVFTIAQDTFLYREGNRRFSAVGRYITEKMPERAIFLSIEHSGSIRYYSGRLTVRYDWVPAVRLDAVLDDLRRLGYHPYILLEEWEEEGFRRMFKGNPVGALDWPPVAMLNHSIRVRIYDPADRSLPHRRETDVFFVNPQALHAPRTPDTRRE